MKQFIISESERNFILNQHKKYLKEETSSTGTTTGTTTTGTTTTGTTTGTTTDILPGVENQKVKELQDLLITKFKSGISSDSKLGPKTLDSAIRALLGQEQLKKTIQPKPKVKPKTPTQTPTSGDTEVTQGLKNAALGVNPQSIENKFKLPTTDFSKYVDSPINKTINTNITKKFNEPQGDEVT